MLGVSLEKTPGCLVLNIAMELSSDLAIVSVFLQLQSGLVHSNDIADLTNDRAIFKTTSVDDDDCEVDIIINTVLLLVTKGMKSAINDFEGDKPFAFGALLDGVCCINNNTIDVQIVTILVHGVQGMVPDLHSDKHLVSERE